MTNNFLIRLIFAAVLGGIIGFERDIHGRAAGLRTNLLISLGAASFMLISQYIAESYSTEAGNSVFRADPARIAAQIVTGVGFLGAGAVVKYGFSIRGLTTAACIWISAAIGMSSGAGFYELAIVTTLIGLFSLIVLSKFEKNYAKDSYRIVEVETSNDTDITTLISVLKRKNLRILYLEKRRNYETNKMFIRFTIKIHQKGVTDKLSHIIVEDMEAAANQIYKINWLRQ